MRLILTEEERREKRRLRQKKWRDNNKEKDKAATKRWIENNKERHLKRRREYYNENKERILQLNEESRQRHLDECLYYGREYYYFRKYGLTTNEYKNKERTEKMNTNWNEAIKEIDEKIAKLQQLKRSIIEMNSEENFEGVYTSEAEAEPEVKVDRYGYKKGEKRVYYDLPDNKPYHNYKKMKHVPLEGAPDYELYENGELFSRNEGRFLAGEVRNNCGDIVWTVINENGRYIEIWKRFEMEKCFGKENKN